VSILAGLVQPDAGTIRIDGKPVVIESPQRARQLGIATVFQDLGLVDQRDVASNLFLGREPRRFRVVVDRKRMIREATSAITRLGINLPSVRTAVAELSGGQRQGVAVARAFIESARVTLMDEPTAALGVREAAHVLRLISRLHQESQAVLLVSHNLASVFAHAHRVLVMRHGRIVGEREIKETTLDEVVALITGARRGDAT
jgi:ABC-type sugar transport system ATPase subunit